MNYLEIIKEQIKLSLSLLTDKPVNFTVELPDLEHGDATSNFCLVSAKVLGLSPQQVFEKIEPTLTKTLSKMVERVEFKNPGFVNFYFKNQFIKENLSEGDENTWWKFWKMSHEPQKVYSKKYSGKKVIVEHSSPNLFKPFNVGHLMNNFTGEFIVRILKEVDANVCVTSFPSDISIGIAKAIYIIKKEGGLGQEIFKKDSKEIVTYLGECYVKGVNEYKSFESENNQEKIKEVKEISNNLYGNIKSEELDIYNFTKKINLDYFYKNLEGLGSHFDGFIFESESGVVGKQIVLDHTPQVFTKSEGAIVYIPEEERKDINTTVFINSEGNPTYEAKDIGLIDLKFKKFFSGTTPDYSIYVTDNEQIPHFKVVLAASGKINPTWEANSVHVPHGRMTFKGKKMSSRLGGVPSAEEVISVVLEDVQERSGGRNTDMDVALSALRISILRSKPGVNIDFDPDKASSFEGDSGPYLCYTHVRSASLLEKGVEKKYVPQLNNESEVTKVERKIVQFENIVEMVADELAPQKLVKYLFELSSEFNSFYAQEKILTDDKKQSEHNLYIVKQVKSTLCKGLYILGIDAPEKM